MNHFVSEDQVKANIGYGHLFQRLWPYLRQHLILLVSSVTAVVAMTIVSRILPTLIGQAVEKGVVAKDFAGVIAIAKIYFGLVVMQTSLQLAYQWMFAHLGNRVLYYLRSDLIAHVQNLPMQYFNKTPIGRIVTRLTNDVSNLSDLFSDGVVSIFVELVMMIGILVAMFLISPRLALVTLIAAPFFLWLSIKLSNKIREVYREAKMKLSQLNSYLAENISGMKVIQLYNRVPDNTKVFEAHSSDYKDLTLKSIRFYALMQPIMNLFTAVTVTSALAYGGYLTSDRALSIGLLVAFILHVQDFIPPLREILEKYQQFQNSLTSAERVFQLFDEPEEADLTNESKLPRLDGEIKFKGLYFRYEENLPYVLENINVTIPAGSSCALVGRTGSGKSTFVALIQKLYPPPGNSIYLDGEPIETFGKLWLRERVGVVQQDAFLFRGTIAENVHLFDPKVSATDVEEACNRIGYLEFLRASGRDLSSMVEERGANLSFGERQLIAFARIIAFKPQVLILDEATANIDSQTEQLLQKAIAEAVRGRTSLIIAHRLSTIENSDQILVFSDGQIVEKGSHSELISKQGHYKELHDLQTGDTNHDQVSIQ